MAHKIIEQWHFNGISVLRLDKEKIVRNASEDYRLYRIDGVIYKPVMMSHTDGKCIAIKAEGNFIGKEVEFLKEEQ